MQERLKIEEMEREEILKREEMELPFPLSSFAIELEKIADPPLSLREESIGLFVWSPVVYNSIEISKPFPNLNNCI